MLSLFYQPVPALSIPTAILFSQIPFIIPSFGQCWKQGAVAARFAMRRPLPERMGRGAGFALAQALQSDTKIGMLYKKSNGKGLSAMTKTYKTGMIAAAILYMIVGLVLIIWPEAARAVICYVLGAALLIYGLYRIAAYFFRELPMQLQFGVAIGVACVVAGLLLLFKAGFVVTVFGVIIGAILIVDAIFRLQNALDIRRMGGRHFTPLLICALVMLVFGVVLLFNPFAAVITATIIGGVVLLLDGCLTLWSVIESSKLVSADAEAPVRVK